MLRAKEIEELSLSARHAARARDWQTVERFAKQILKRDSRSAEGHFLHGLAAKATGLVDAAEKSFRRALQIAGDRYDAAVELAELYVGQQRNTEAVTLLDSYKARLGNSPLYLEMAASAYSRLDLHEEALPLYRRACELQPEIERFRTGLATCNTNLGDIGSARRIYEELLERHPDHQRFHFELSRLGTASDFRHVSRMKAVLERSALPPEKNIFIWYALGKELEDLGRWDEAFSYYEQAGNAASGVADYRVDSDIELVEAIIETCDATWLRRAESDALPDRPTPVFIVGLPRSGTTLLERMLASHSRIQTVGETFFFQSALCRLAGSAAGRPTAEAIERASTGDMHALSAQYLEAVDYKLGTEPLFIEKLPENFLYLGFIAAAFPDARIIHVMRHPMDVCFAMYKQSYFRFAYRLEDLARFYVAYYELMGHWRRVLGDRVIELQYEHLVAEPEHEIRGLLARLGLDFESACLSPESNQSPSRTASRVQIREGIHRRSVDRWKHFEHRLAPLADHLLAHGIEIRDRADS